MFIFEIIIPGTWLDYEDREWAWKIERQLDSLQSQFFEANLALNLFISAQSSRASSYSKDAWEADSKRRQEISQILEEEYTKQGKSYWDNYHEIYLETEIILKREKWQQGIIPREFEHNIVFIYARAFLYALDAFDKFLGVLSREENVPEVISELHKKISDIFPDLRGVRNTAQHLEDRSRGLGAGRNPKPLDLKPIENNFISAPNGGALVLNSLNGSRYGSTMADGHYGEVDISPESMSHLQEILNNILGSFKWHGSKQHKPSV
ncbi:hypothetical protein [Acinetobacter soli]|uniref:hypothetical protein n=1 Tax=Acinetobacter soli TaxID=487316 RepID=UPI00124D7AEA|nr:hypothetical protein [Acinetobacter soli]